MATTKKATPSTAKAATASQPTTPLFGKENYRWMLIGIVIILLIVFSIVL